jgi:hypothetical protein
MYTTFSEEPRLTKTRETPPPVLPTYLILRYPCILKQGAVIYSAPVLVETYDYLKFYLAGCSDHEPLPLLGYEALGCFPHGTTYLTAVAGFTAWRLKKIQRWVTEGAYLTN